MNAAAIRQKLHNYLEVANDKKIKAIYTMMEQEIEGAMVDYTDDLKQDLDKRYAGYKDGSEKAITASESKKRVQKLLKGSHK